MVFIKRKTPRETDVHDEQMFAGWGGEPRLMIQGERAGGRPPFANKCQMGASCSPGLPGAQRLLTAASTSRGTSSF